MLDRGEDPLAEATRGLYHWDDPGMDDPETGWEEFNPGMRVEIRTQKGWLSGTLRETPMENDRALVVECDKKWHDNVNNYEGRGATIAVFHNTRRGILSNIRSLPQRFTLPEKSL